jgi:hypothetical protein
MINGVASFFFGLIFFIIDTQPVAVWVTILLISVVSTGLIQTVKVVSSLGIFAVWLRFPVVFTANFLPTGLLRRGEEI